MRKVVLILCFFTGFQAFSQHETGFKKLIWYPDTNYLVIDTLLLIHGSVSITDSANMPLPPNQYHINYANSSVTFKTIPNRKLTIQYLSLPIPSGKTYFTYDTTLIQPKLETYNQIQNRLTETNTVYTQVSENISSNGYVSRSVKSSGSNGVSVGTGMFIEFEGQINENVWLNAYISDESVPQQPEGGTYDINELDKVQIKLQMKNAGLAAGDIFISDTMAYFSGWERKVKGIDFTSGNVVLPDSSTVNVQVAAGIAKGVFNRMVFNGAESNQGPYYLSGAYNEPFIILLAGTEKIFLNGVLLKQGPENDYIVNYSTAAITFNQNNIITSQSRIIAEFEYSVLQYNKYLMQTRISLQNSNRQSFISYYSEADARNQPLMENFSLSDRNTLATLSANNGEILVPSATLQAFTKSENLYYKTDTLNGSLVYTDVFVLATDSTLPVYNVVFTYAGQGMGHYIEKEINSFGKTYKWVAPENGKPVGSYNPVKKLIAPQKHSLLIVGHKQQFNNGLQMVTEAAVSQNQVNRFALADDAQGNNAALHVTANWDLSNHLPKNQNLILGGVYNYSGKNFRILHTITEPEFVRKWNIKPNTQQIVNNALFKALYFYTDKLRLQNETELIFIPKMQWGIGNRTFFNSDFKWLISRIEYGHNYTRTDLTRYTMQHYNAVFGIPLAKWFLEQQLTGENILLQPVQSGLPDSASKKFVEYTTAIRYTTASGNKIYFRYQNQVNYIPVQNNFGLQWKAHMAVAGFSGTKNNNSINSELILRNYLPLMQQVGTSVSGKMLAYKNSGSFAMLHKSIQLQLEMENAAGTEEKMQYQFVKMPAGNGTHKWIDYNQNGLQEPDEFETGYLDIESEYIKIYTRTGQYIPVTQNKNLLRIYANPKFSNSGWMQNFLGRITNVTILRSERKWPHTAFNFKIKAIPDSVVLQKIGLVDNIVSFNLKAIQLTWQFQSSVVKNQLYSGMELSGMDLQKFILQVRPHTNLLLNAGVDKGLKQLSSTEFINRNYKIETFSVFGGFAINNISKFTWNSDYIYAVKKDVIAKGTSNNNTFNSRLEYTLSESESVSFNLSVVQLQYKSQTVTAAMWELTEGLFPGLNTLLTLSGKKMIGKNLETEFTYQLRKAENNKAIHTAMFQFKALL